MKSPKDSSLNILFLGGGKRVSLANRFIEAGKKIGKTINVYSYEASEHQPISLVGKVIKGRLWDDPGISADIVNVLINYEIDLLISNVDPALAIHASLKNTHPSALYSSDIDQVKICYSKIIFQRECERLGLPIIPSWDGVSFPSLAKPDFGSASQGIMTFNSIQDFEGSRLRSEEYCFQKYINGTEFTVDAYVSQGGEIIGISPRVRIQTLGGESVVTETRSDGRIFKLSVTVIEKMNLRGPLTLQFIRECTSDVDYLMEVNTRLGGGVICSIEAGVDIPLMLLNDVCGLENRKVFNAQSILMKRFFSEAFYAVNY